MTAPEDGGSPDQAEQDVETRETELGEEDLESVAGGTSWEGGCIPMPPLWPN